MYVCMYICILPPVLLSALNMWSSVLNSILVYSLGARDRFIQPIFYKRFDLIASVCKSDKIH